MPHWADGASAQVNGEPATAEPQDGWLTVTRSWAAGDELVLDLPLDVRFTYADPRVDAARGSVALERGPLVYCLEAVDNPGQRLDDIVIDTDSAPVVERQENLLGGVTTIAGPGASSVLGRTAPGGRTARRRRSAPRPRIPRPSTLSAVPYFVWGNRDEGAMRVWIPCRVVSTSTTEAFLP